MYYTYYSVNSLIIHKKWTLLSNLNKLKLLISLLADAFLKAISNLQKYKFELKYSCSDIKNPLMFGVQDIICNINQVSEYFMVYAMDNKIDIKSLKRRTW